MKEQFVQDKNFETNNNSGTNEQNKIPETIGILSDDELLPPTSIFKIVSFLRYLSSNKNEFSKYLRKLSVWESTLKTVGNLTEEERQKLEVFCEEHWKCNKKNLNENQVVVIWPNGYVKAVLDKKMSESVISSYKLNDKNEVKEYYPMDVYVIPVKELSFLTNKLEKMNKEIFKLDGNYLLVYNELSWMFYIVDESTLKDGKVSSEHIKFKRNINDFPKQNIEWRG